MKQYNDINHFSSKTQCLEKLATIKDKKTLDQIYANADQENNIFLNELLKICSDSVKWLNDNKNNLVLVKTTYDPWNTLPRLADIEDEYENINVELLMAGYDTILVKEKDSDKTYNLMYDYKKWIMENKRIKYCLKVSD